MIELSNLFREGVWILLIVGTDKLHRITQGSVTEKRMCRMIKESIEIDT